MSRSLSYSEISLAMSCQAREGQKRQIERARELRSEGLSFRLIGIELGVTTMTAFKWCKPDYEPRYIPRKAAFHERLMPRLVVPSLGPCLEYRGSRHIRYGHGMITVNGRHTYAHRVAFELANGPIPEGKIICHHCNNPPCCEPTHLYAGTSADNARDASAAGTMFRGAGEDSIFCKHSDAKIAQARQLRAEGLTLREIGERLGIEASYVSRICRGEVRPLD